MSEENKVDNTENNKEEPKQDKPKRKIVGYKDLGMAWLMSGGNLERIQKLNAQTAISKQTHLKAIKWLNDDDGDCPDTTPWKQWVNETFPAGEGTQGREPPKVGEKRKYKVQTINKKDKETGEIVGTSGPFIRLALDSLNVKKGDHVEVSFEDGNINIVVTEAPEENSSDEDSGQE